MIADDLKAMTQVTALDIERGFVCNICGECPTCPMLKDSIWDRIKPEPKIHEKRHRIRPERWVKEVRELLCWSCAELRLGRQITTEDLKLCLGEYTAMFMLQRAEEKHRAALAAMTKERDEEHALRHNEERGVRRELRILKQDHAAMTKARDEACDLLDEHLPYETTFEHEPYEQEARRTEARVVELRAVGKDPQ